MENKSEEKGVKTEEKPTEKPLEKPLNDETLKKLESEEIDFDDLTKEQKTDYHNRFVEGDEDWSSEKVEAQKTDSSTEKPADSVADSQKPPDPNVKVEPTEAESAEAQELKQKLKTQRDANNTLQQKLSSANEKLANANAMKVPEPPKIEDALDDNLNKQDKWNHDLANKLNTYADNEVKSIQKGKVATQQSLLYSDISILQTENPELRTSLPIESIDKTYTRFRDGVAGVGATNDQKSEAVNKFFTDADFRKSKEGEGHVFPINDADWKGYQTVTKIIGYKRNGGVSNYDFRANGDRYGEVDVAYFKYKKESGFIPDPVKQAALDAATKVADQVADNQNQPNLLSPEDGKASEGIDGMTEAQAEQWLIDNPTPSSPEEVATLRAILKKYSPSSAPKEQEVVF